MKKLMCVLAAVLLTLSACGNTDSGSASVSAAGSGAPDVSEQVFDLDDYKSKVWDFREEIAKSALPLYSVGLYEYNYLTSVQNFGGESAVKRQDSDETAQKGYEWYEEQEEATETRESLDARNTVIQNAYKEIILIETDGKEAEEIEAAVRELYEGYTTIYETVNNPAMGPTSLGSEIDSGTSKLKESSNTLDLFIGESENPIE